MPKRLIDQIDPTSVNYSASVYSLAYKKAWLLDLFLQQQEEKNQNRNFFKRLFSWLVGKKTITFKKGDAQVVYIPDPHDPTKKIAKKFKLTHDIVCSHLKVNALRKKVPEYNIINPDEGKFGQGVWGTVIRIVGVLTRRNGALAFKDKKKMVDKIQTISTKAAKHEANILRVIHPTSKPIVIEYLPFVRRRSHIVDKEFGMSLTKFLKSDEFEKLPFEKRLLLSVNLLRELQVIHARGFIHHDIWPNNILINPVTCEVVIIDFGSAHSKQDFFQQGGKKRFAAPEKFSLGRETVDERSDIYAAMLSLATLWGGKKRGRFTFQKGFFEALKQLTSLIFLREDTFSLDTVGQNLNVPAEQIDAIKSTLKSGLTFSPEGRAGLDDLIKQFEHFRIKDPVAYSAFLEANFMRSELLKLENANAALFGKNAAQNKAALDQIFPSLQASLKRLSKTPAQLNEYIYTLGVQAFHGATSLVVIEKRANKIIQQYVANSDRVKKMNDYLACKLTLFTRTKNNDNLSYITFLKDQINQLYYVFYKMESHHMGLDDLVKLNKQCEKRLIRISDAFKKMQADPRFREPSSQHKILNRLALAKDTDELTHKQNGIRLAVKNYLVSRYVSAER